MKKNVLIFLFFLAISGLQYSVAQKSFSLTGSWVAQHNGKVITIKFSGNSACEVKIDEKTTDVTGYRVNSTFSNIQFLTSQSQKGIKCEPDTKAATLTEVKDRLYSGSVQTDPADHEVLIINIDFTVSPCEPHNSGNITFTKQ